LVDGAGSFLAQGTNGRFSSVSSGRTLAALLKLGVIEHFRAQQI